MHPVLSVLNLHRGTDFVVASHVPVHAIGACFAGTGTTYVISHSSRELFTLDCPSHYAMRRNRPPWLSRMRQTILHITPTRPTGKIKLLSLRLQWSTRPTQRPRFKDTLSVRLCPKRSNRRYLLAHGSSRPQNSCVWQIVTTRRGSTSFLQRS